LEQKKVLTKFLEIVLKDRDSLFLRGKALLRKLKAYLDRFEDISTII